MKLADLEQGLAVGVKAWEDKVSAVEADVAGKLAALEARLILAQAKVATFGDNVNVPS